MATLGKLPMFGFKAGTIGFVTLFGFGAGAPLPPPPPAPTPIVVPVALTPVYGQVIRVTEPTPPLISGITADVPQSPTGRPVGWVRVPLSGRDGYRARRAERREAYQQAAVAVVEGVSASMHIGVAVAVGEQQRAATAVVEGVSASMHVGQVIGQGAATADVVMPAKPLSDEDWLMVLAAVRGEL